MFLLENYIWSITKNCFKRTFTRSTNIISSYIQYTMLVFMYCILLYA